MLEAVAQGKRLTQRSLAAKLGMALGLTNIYMKRLVRKGYIKCVNIQSNRLLYLITPKGIAAKTRLTYEFMVYSLGLYREVRQHLRSSLHTHLRNGATRIAIYGTGEAAELTYLSLREHGIDPVAVFGSSSEEKFCGLHVSDPRHHAASDYDLLIVATLAPPETIVAELKEYGIPPTKLLTLRPMRKSDGLRSRGQRSTRSDSRRSNGSRHVE